MVFALQHALSAAAGGGCVDTKEYEKKREIMQQCKEKIESVCFDIRLRKVLAISLLAISLLLACCARARGVSLWVFKIARARVLFTNYPPPSSPPG